MLKFKNNNYLKNSALLRFSHNSRVGIFGGSFNPPHQGHLYITKEAIKRLNLDIVIWLVTPLNPLKYTLKAPLDLQVRISLCKKICQGYQKIKISPLEDSFSTNYTYNTLNLLRKLSNKSNKLFWIMGEDNLSYFHKFKNWRFIVENFNMAVFSRSDASYKSLFQKCPTIYKDYLVTNLHSNLRNHPAKIKYFLIKKNSLSSTYIRNNPTL